MVRQQGRDCSKRWLSRRWLALLVSLVALMLSGCFRYDVGIQFDHQTHGQITQQIRLSERAAALAGPTVQAWISNLEKQVYRLGGQVHRPSPEQVALVVPFSNGADLMKRFNQLFQAEPAPVEGLADLTTVQSHLSLEQQNRVFAIRNHLTYQLDLSGLPQKPQEATGGLDSLTDWLDLRFALQTPWGISQNTATSPPSKSLGRAQVWQLEPGKVNDIDVVFWVPSLIGLGGVAIAVFVLLGYFLKYGLRQRSLRRRSS